MEKTKQSFGLGLELEHLRTGNIAEISIKSRFPLFQWLESNPNNLEALRKLSRVMFYIRAEDSLFYMHQTMDKSRHFFPYLGKKQKVSDEQYEIMCKYFKQIFLWGKAEILKNKRLILSVMEDKKFISEFADSLGFTNQERKIMKLNEIKIVMPKYYGTKSLFSFT